jgi:hypothetical protein
LEGSAVLALQKVLMVRHHPGAEQFDAGAAATHGPFVCLQSISLALRLRFNRDILPTLVGD